MMKNPFLRVNIASKWVIDPLWLAPRGQHWSIIGSFAAKQWKRLHGLWFCLSSCEKVTALWFPFRVTAFQIEQHFLTKTGAGTVLHCPWTWWDTKASAVLNRNYMGKSRLISLLPLCPTVKVRGKSVHDYVHCNEPVCWGNSCGIF